MTIRTRAMIFQSRRGRGHEVILKYFTGIFIIFSVLSSNYCDEQEHELLPPTVGRFIWNVAVGISKDTVDTFKFLCGGVITTPLIVITSASCLEPQNHGNITIDLDQVTILDREGSILFVSSVTKHPDYIFGDKNHDIVALKLSTPLVNETLAPILGPEHVKLQDFLPFKGDQLVTNWKYQTNDGIQFRLSPERNPCSIIDGDVCEKSYKKYFSNHSMKFNATFPKGISTQPLICVRVIGQPCEKQEGYQLILPDFTIPSIQNTFPMKVFLLGTRFEKESSDSKRCDFLELPIIFTNLSSHKKWIAEVEAKK